MPKAYEEYVPKLIDAFFDTSRPYVKLFAQLRFHEEFGKFKNLYYLLLETYEDWTEVLFLMVLIRLGT